jgi:F-type H+-transporting ATPase subunit delta
MKSARRLQRDARQLLRLCLVNGVPDEGRVRHVVGRVIAAAPPGGLSTLSRFQRLVRLARAAHSADVESATPLSDDVRAAIAAALAGRHGETLAVSFIENPALLGGVRVRVGSAIFDGSVRARLHALGTRF